MSILQKKGIKLECDICRRISLLNKSYKILNTIFTQTPSSTYFLLQMFLVYHCGYRKGRTTKGHLLELKLVTKKDDKFGIYWIYIITFLILSKLKIHR